MLEASYLCMKKSIDGGKYIGFLIFLRGQMCVARLFMSKIFTKEHCNWEWKTCPMSWNVWCPMPYVEIPMKTCQIYTQGIVIWQKWSDFTTIPCMSITQLWKPTSVMHIIYRTRKTFHHLGLFYYLLPWLFAKLMCHVWPCRYRAIMT